MSHSHLSNDIEPRIAKPRRGEGDSTREWFRVGGLGLRRFDLQQDTKPIERTADSGSDTPRLRQSLACPSLAPIPRTPQLPVRHEVSDALQSP
jgi:hypothetical protein